MGFWGFGDPKPQNPIMLIIINGVAVLEPTIGSQENASRASYK